MVRGRAKGQGGRLSNAEIAARIAEASERKRSAPPAGPNLPPPSRGRVVLGPESHRIPGEREEIMDFIGRGW